jgi:hypothetical protein
MSDGTQALAERLPMSAKRADALAYAILADGSVYLTPAEAARVAAIEKAARAIVEDSARWSWIDPDSQALIEALETSR